MIFKKGINPIFNEMFSAIEISGLLICSDTLYRSFLLFFWEINGSFQTETSGVIRYIKETRKC